MQKSQHQIADTRDSISTADAGVSIPDSGCKGLYKTDSRCKTLHIRQRIQEPLYQTADVRDYITQWMQESLYQTVDARDSIYHTAYAGDPISNRRCTSLYIRQRMQESLYQTMDARDFIRQDATYCIRQDAGVSISDSGCKILHVYQTADARDSISDSGCKRHSIRQPMQETISDSRCRSLYTRQRMQETIYQK